MSFIDSNITEFKHPAELPETPEQPSFFDKIRRRISWEGVAITAAALGALTLGASGVILAKDQDAGIDKSLELAGAETITGFASVDVEGTIYNYSPGSLHNAIVDLSTGNTCDIQFTTVEGDGFWGRLSRDEAKIVSFGTCPTDSPN